MVAPYWSNQTCFMDLTLLASAPPWQIPSEEGRSFSGAGHNLAPAPRSLEPPRLVPGLDEVDFGELSPAQGLEKHLSASMLKVYMAAVAANHNLVDGRSLGKHNLITRFLRGAQRINPASHTLLGPFCSPPGPTERTVRAFNRSVCDECLEFGLAYSHVVLRPQPGYVPKGPSGELASITLRGGNPDLTLLRPVRAFHVNLERTQNFRQSEQFFVCFGGQRKGKAVSKQRLAHWIVDAILRAYQVQDVPCPLSVRAHSTRGIAATSAVAHGASLADICRAAGWATPNTFARFYNLRMELVSS
ncbi:putative aspartoacylase [Labeo rohita]|uniref:Aspartoacylase n=1 Tax=Labeo rohita TaxID=84645 RepID=A0ABQ8L8D4_LABRO|nr:putative aspartoacylase [Labeo rohita]